MVVILAVVTAAMLGACSDDESLTDPDKLCPLGAGLGARISGTPVPVDLCVSNDETVTEYEAPPADRYTLTASTVDDSLEITIGISFRVQGNQLREMAISSDSTTAFANAGIVWFFYRERKTGTYDYSTRTLAGNFRLTVIDENVATGAFSDMIIELEDASSGADAGTRVISEGFFSVTPD